ncbi:MAG: DinB family protein [Saprospiraceae bacterium]|nr:DinB family protein [Saprospiraceae bacterium]
MPKEYSTRLEVILTKFENEIKYLDLAEMSIKPTSGAWSKKEIVGHLIDSALSNYHRFISAEKKGNLEFEGYDQDKWVIKNDYENRDINELIALFLGLNRHISNLISTLDPNTLAETTLEHNFDQICMKGLEKETPASLNYLIEDYLFHLNHHLKQILS